MTMTKENRRELRQLASQLRKADAEKLKLRRAFHRAHAGAEKAVARALAKIGKMHCNAVCAAERVLASELKGIAKRTAAIEKRASILQGRLGQ